MFSTPFPLTTPHNTERRWSSAYPLNVDGAGTTPSPRPPSPTPSAPLLSIAPPTYAASVSSLTANNYDAIIDAYFRYRALEDAMRYEGVMRGDAFDEVQRECDRLHQAIVGWRVGKIVARS